MSLYGQDAEIELLTRLLALTTSKVVVDVGAEQGEVAGRLREAGASQVYLIEPEPRNLEELRRRFRDDPEAVIVPCAATTTDGPVELWLSSDPEGGPISFGHTLLTENDTDEVAWRASVTVDGRRLETIALEHEVPHEIGILKTDTEGSDLDVLDGLGDIRPEVVMLEYWVDLPHSLGRCPWSVQDVQRRLGPRGFSHFAAIVHDGELTSLGWDDGQMAPGAFGNLIFFHDSVVERASFEVLATASAISRGTAALAVERSIAAADRLAVIDELTRAVTAYEEAFAAPREDNATPRPADEVMIKATEAEVEPLSARAAAEELVTAIGERGKAIRDVVSAMRAQPGRAGKEELALVDDAARAVLEGAQLLLYRAPWNIQPRLSWLQARRRALRLWLAPRIGQLSHYPPRPIRLPRSHLDTRLPAQPPTISIVTPSFQQAQFLGRTIRSVLEQEYPALEYVVQDGGSTDGSAEVIREHLSALTSWASEPDEGQGDAINRGFARTSGEIMAWLNSDDLLMPGALSYVSRYFAGHPNVDVVYGDRILIDENDREIGRWILPRHDDGVLRIADFVPQETLFWRRRIWDQVGGHVDLSFAYALDWDLLLRFQDAGACMVHVPRFLGAFRVHNAQKTTATAQVGRDEMARLRRRSFGRDVEVEDLPELLRPYLVRHRVRHGAIRLFDRIGRRRVLVAPGASVCKREHPG